MQNEFFAIDKENYMLDYMLMKIFGFSLDLYLNELGLHVNENICR